MSLSIIGTSRELLYVAPQVLQKDKSDWGFAHPCCCEGGTDLSPDGAYALGPESEHRVAELQAEVVVKFSRDNPQHEELLSAYFTAALGSSSGRPPTEHRDQRWKQLGFQNEDPRTDFRGGGLLSLRCMLFMAKEKPANVHKMLQESGSLVEIDAHGTMSKAMKAVDPNTYYPFSAAVVNICFELVRWLLLDPRTSPRHGEDHCSGAAYRRFAQMLEMESDFFFLLVAAAVQAMHSDWVGSARSSMELGESIRSAKRRVVCFFENRPQGTSSQLIADLRASWELPEVTEPWRLSHFFGFG